MKQAPQLNQVMNLRFSMPVFHPSWYFPGSLDLPGWVSNDLWVLQISMICLLLSKVAMLCRDFFQNGIKTKYQSHHQRNHLLHLLLRYLLTDYRGSPVSAVFGSPANRTIGKAALIGDWFSTEIVIWDFWNFKIPFFCLFSWNYNEF